ncbi:hypothetical protein D3C81_1139600 [compost metagenome]
MTSKVQMDPTGDDVNYFVERGFSRHHSDLNWFYRVDQHGLVEARHRVIGRPTAGVRCWLSGATNGWP